MVNIHYLKEKKKRINRELGKLYTKKIALKKSIDTLEEAKLHNKTLLASLKLKAKNRELRKL